MGDGALDPIGNPQDLLKGVLASGPAVDHDLLAIVEDLRHAVKIPIVGQDDAPWNMQRKRRAVLAVRL